MAFLQETPREPFLNAPPVVLWLIAIMVGLHALRVLLPGTLPDDIIENYALLPSRYAAALATGVPPGETFPLIFAFISYMFLHGDFTHVGLNSLWLLVFGPLVTRRLGSFQFLLFFVLCGIAAAVVHLTFYWGSTMAVIGASGGVSGLMGAGMRIVYGRLTGAPNGLAPVLSRPIVMFSAVWTVVNIVSGVLRLGVTQDFTLIAWVAHLGGYFTGLLTIGLFGSHAWERRGLPAL
jgi:membrane associated rhomboid family serine protease